MKAIKRIVIKALATLNIIIIVAMVVSGYSDRISPATYPWAAAAGLVFPVLLGLNIVFLFLWLVIKPKWVLLPFAGLIVCYPPVRLYTPLNVAQEVPDSALKIISYNVWNFHTWRDCGEPSEIIEYLREEDADIVCLQESFLSGGTSKVAEQQFAAMYAHRDTAVSESGGDRLTLLSRFPIVGKEHIRYSSRNNNSTAFLLQIGGDTVTFIANHFESIGFTDGEKQQFNQMIKGRMSHNSAQTTSRGIIAKLGEAAALRAPQAEAVARYVEQRRGKSIILCGDFNDNPISYVRRTVARHLTDCYVESGNGPGISYNDSGFYVRIDNIMCSADWQPVACKVDNKIKASDHYPICCRLVKRSK